MKLLKIVTILIFLIFISFMGMKTLTSKYVYESEIENRTLSGKPDFTVELFWNGDYVNKFETFFKDQFYKRIEFTKVYYKIIHSINKATLNGILMGEGNWITNAPTKNKVYQDNLMLLNNQTKTIGDFSKKEDIPAYFFLLPEKSVAVNHVFPYHPDQHTKNEFLHDVPGNIDNQIKYMDLNSILDNQYSDSEIENFYYKTDHHWNYIGAHKGYQILVDELRKDFKEIPPPLDENELLKSCATHEKPYFSGSNNRFILLVIDSSEEQLCTFELKDNSIFKTFNFTTSSGKESSNWDEYFKIGIDMETVTYARLTTYDYPKIVFKQKSPPNDLKVLILNDSYFNAMSSYIGFHFAETHLLDMRHFKGNANDYALENDIDLIILAHNSTGLAGDVIRYNEE